MAAFDKEHREAPEERNEGAEQVSSQPSRSRRRRRRVVELEDDGLNQVVLAQCPPQAIGVRNHRELTRPGTAVDLLMQGEAPVAGDLLVQRLKALETSHAREGKPPTTRG